jgi:hypothetical protein
MALADFVSEVLGCGIRMAKASVIVGEDDQRPLEIGPTLAVLKSPRSSSAAVRKAIRLLRLRGNATATAKALVLRSFAAVHPDTEEVEGSDPTRSGLR